ncbi:MAG: microcystin degradation protein MlrC [Pedosphaera sp. Tous-C6FEB]|nr:MAG: microcystin degradation protein MlrC [Pedosphaera sp. Tous-C6FEB]
MSARVLIAGLFHETHTFLEGSTGLADFEVRQGEELLACRGDASPLGGILESAQRFGWTVLPTVDFRASPSATVQDAVVETFWEEFRRRAEPELLRGVDGICLVLHGAMVSASLPDVEGELLARLRTLPGAARVPVFGVFDLHANFTERMARHADCLVAYRENPHTDGRESAQRAATLLQRCLTTGEVPRLTFASVPVIWPPTGTGTAGEPMRGLEALARQLETRPGIWAANVVAGFSFADTFDTGVSFSVVSTASEAEARAALAELCALAVRNQQQGNVSDPPVDEVLAKLVPTPPGLTVLVEPSDNIGGGAPGDGTGLLRALLRHQLPACAIAINDAEAVAHLATLPLGARTTLPIGGKGSRLDAGPLVLEVELLSRRDGRFQLEDKQSHLASMAGDAFDMGPCAVVRHAGVTILLTSRKTPPFDLGQWRSQGLEPRDFSFLGVKAAVAHRRAYDPIAARMLWVDTPGPCTSNVRSLPYQRVRRPVFPLDA